MDRFMTLRRRQTPQDSGNVDNGWEAIEVPQEIVGAGLNGNEAEEELSPPPQLEATEIPSPFMGMKVQRRACLLRECHGDYIDVPSDPYLSKLIIKQGDRNVLFADKILRFTGTGKIKRRFFIITEFAIYLIDPDSDALKRRISLSAVHKLSMSELNDNFFAIVIPNEYDCLMASTRKTEIIHVLIEATKSASEYELEILRSNRFEYNIAANTVKQAEFEEVNGSIKARFTMKEK